MMCILVIRCVAPPIIMGEWYVDGSVARRACLLLLVCTWQLFSGMLIDSK